MDWPLALFVGVCFDVSVAQSKVKLLLNLCLDSTPTKNSLWGNCCLSVWLSMCLGCPFCLDCEIIGLRLYLCLTTSVCLSLFVHIPGKLATLFKMSNFLFCLFCTFPRMCKKDIRNKGHVYSMFTEVSNTGEKKCIWRRTNFEHT